MALAAVGVSLASNGPGQATGVKVGEVTDRSAILWTRLTAGTQRVTGGMAPPTAKARGDRLVTSEEVARYNGACPGAPGRIRVRYGTQADLGDGIATAWVAVGSGTDYTHQFELGGLEAGREYHFATESATPDGLTAGTTVRGRFETAPAVDRPSAVRFCVVTGQMFQDLDHADGFHIYPAMERTRPQFLVFTGDNVYYDNEEPKANSAILARYHWERMFSLPRHCDLLRQIVCYWEMDDHDVLDNDCWPGKKPVQGGSLTFAEGLEIFRQQTPAGPRPYRTFRWGRDLQIWLTEGREFRSPNPLPDGPDKRILGLEQEAWLQRTLRESDATWKVLISPTPIVGPDRGNKKDNHANPAFATEGNRLRAWFAEHLPAGFFIACGDRHWQYHSVHPETGVQEFSCGPASDQHAGGSPGADPAYHRFHRQKGGFLAVQVAPVPGEQSRITFEFRDVHGEVVYQWSQTAPRRAGN